MRILFVHQNFPGQFVHLAPALTQRGHQVLGLTASSNARPTPVPVARYTWKPRNFRFEECRLAKTYAEMTFRGEVVAAAAQDLQKKGFTPDVVFGTPGWGETLFLKEIWPDARHLQYGEFFYGPRGRDVGFDPEFTPNELSSRILVTARNAHLLVAMHAADLILSPTRWQASSFPEYIQHKITVVHDGIDTARITPDGPARVRLPNHGLEFTRGDEVLTFINRNLEPHRGYHIFMRALPKVLERRPNARVVIVGEDGLSYSSKPPGDKSWKQTFLDEVADRLDLSRVHFVGQIPYDTFVNLMRVTRVHAYLTYPFVLSWSMLEAMAAGALVVGSRTPPVEEVIVDGVNGLLVDFFDVERWSDVLSAALAEPDRYEGLRREARRSIETQYDLRRVCLPRLIEFVERNQKLMPEVMN